MPEAIGIAEDVPRIWIQKNYASFNGIRGLAVTAVFFSHYLWIMPAAYLRAAGQYLSSGVDLFFVLSGFLITGILYDSLDTQHYFKNFYIRRTLRIFPLFYAVYLLLFLLKPLLHLTPDPLVPSFLLYVGNLVEPFTKKIGPGMNYFYVMHHGKKVIVASMGHFWSLCVEEQFYLCWPAIIWMVRDRRKLMKICLAGAGGALFIRLAIEWFAPHFVASTDVIYVSTYTRFDTLFVGSWMALFLRGQALTRVQLRRASAWLFCLPLALLVLGMQVRLHVAHLHISRMLSYSFIALIALGLILRSLDDTSRLSRLLRFSPLARLGIVSYGFYVFHEIPNVFLSEIYDSRVQYFQSRSMLRIAIPLAIFAAAWLLAELSFRFYETPFLRLKKKLAPQRNNIHLDIAAASETI